MIAAIVTVVLAMYMGMRFYSAAKVSGRRKWWSGAVGFLSFVIVRTVIAGLLGVVYRYAVTLDLLTAEGVVGLAIWASAFSFPLAVLAMLKIEETICRSGALKDIPRNSN